jgi:hypothetical protein
VVKVYLQLQPNLILMYQLCESCCLHKEHVTGTAVMKSTVITKKCECAVSEMAYVFVLQGMMNGGGNGICKN